jgi:hypothetical protein
MGWPKLTSVSDPTAERVARFAVAPHGEQDERAEVLDPSLAIIAFSPPAGQPPISLRNSLA